MVRRLRQPIVIVPVLIVVGIVGTWWFAFRAGEDATASATTTKQVVDVTSASMSQSVSAEGTVAAADTDDLSFSAAGTVTAVNIKAGDQVTAGQVLATIDSAELEAGVASAEADVADAEARLADDRSAGASDAQIAADETSLSSANDALTNAEEALAGSSLVATFDGTVAAVTVTVGEELTSEGTGGTSPTGSDSGSGRSSGSLGGSDSGMIPGGVQDGTGDSGTTAQIQVVSTGRYTVELAVDSADIDNVAVGQAATVVRSSASSGGVGPGGFPGSMFMNGGNQTDESNGSTPGPTTSGPTTSGDGATATGTVTDVGKVADASSGIATYPVTISFEASGDDFYVGSTVTGDITTNVRENVVQVSALAVTTTDAGATVTVATDGTTTGPTEVRTVTTGLTANGNTEITRGLEAGEKALITITRPSGGGGFSRPTGDMPGGFQGGPPGAVTDSGDRAP